MGVAGPNFEPHPLNLVRIDFFLSCKNAEIFVVIFQVVSNLARNEFSPNLEGVAQKMDLPRPFEVLEVFGWKFKF